MYVFYINLLEKYNEIWKNVSNIIKTEFDIKPVCNKKYLETKIKSYNGKIIKNIHNNKIPKEGSQCNCISVILIDLIYRKDKKNYYPQVFLEECKYVAKEKEMSKSITDDIKFFSHDPDRENFDEENSKEENYI